MPRWVQFVLVFILGLAAGLVYGWVVDPVEYTETAPDRLRADYRADYVLMVAESFHADQDVDLAARRLAVLGQDPPDVIVQQAFDFGRSAGYSESDLALLTALGQALQVASQGGAP